MEARSVKVYRRGFDDIITGVVNAKLADNRSDSRDKAAVKSVQISSPDSGEVHLSASVITASPREKNATLVETETGIIRAFGNLNESKKVSIGVFDLIFFLRKPRLFGRSELTFCVAGVNNPRSTAVKSLQSIHAVWAPIALIAFIVLCAAIFVFSSYVFTDANNALLPEGIVDKSKPATAIRVFQLTLLGIALAFLFRSLFSFLLKRPSAVTASGTLILLSVGFYFSSPIILAVYDSIQPFADPAGAAFEWVFQLLEGAGNFIRNSVVTVGEGICNLNPFCTVSTQSGVDADTSKSFVNILAASFVASLSMISLWSTSTFQRRTIYDLALLLWAGGGKVVLRGMTTSLTQRLHGKNYLKLINSIKEHKHITLEIL